MTSRVLRALALLTAAALALAAPIPASAADPFRVLVFSKTTGFRHDSIPAGIAAIRQLGQQNNFTVDATEDDTQFTDANLARYAAVVFLSATGDPVSTQAEKDAFQRYVERGGGFVGIHAASDSGYTWPWYGQLVGTYFRQHPAQQNALIKVEDRNHPSTQGLPAQFTRFDEWYDFQTNPRANVHVLTTVDDSSYTGSTMGADHPTTWCHNVGSGRSWYTALGHTTESFGEANFLHLLLGGIQTAAGAVPADCSVGTPPPATPVISLRAHANGKLVTAENGGASALIANRTAVGAWEQFDQLDAGNGNIALRAHANNRIVTAENAGASPLIANRTSIGAWETFQLLHNPDGSVSLRAGVNGKLVTAENGGASALIANRTAVGPWEEFDLIAAAAPAVAPASVSPAAAAAVPPDSRFQKVPLDTNTSNPMALDVAADGRVFYVDRLGDVRVILPAGGTVLAAHLNVFTANESGLLNLALDPAFATNHWVYLYYSPTAANVDRLSRFTANGNTLDLASERIVLDVPVQRAECCHHGAGMVFDKRTGNLWLSTGDNTNPFASDGYTPIDERAGRSAWDAQGTAGNTNSLSGKVLRIHPETSGTYTIPAGNLFAPGTAGTRPEIYQMGERNPFRMGMDPKTGFPLVANFGPDAGAANPSRGPQNTVEWDIASRPGNVGWPYCIGPNIPYNDFNFATNTSGLAFDCAGGPTNNSPNNTGQGRLAPAIPALIYYHGSPDPAHFPQLNGGGPIAGPVYRFDPNLVSSRKWPVDLDGRAIFGEWTANKLFAFQLDTAGTNVTAIDPLLTSMTFLKPMDFKFGPDGALYVIEWGSGFGGDNTDSQIDRIDFLNGAAQPVARASANRTNGPAPLTVNFSSAGSADPGGAPLTFSWAFGDGTTSTAANPSHTYAAGNFTAVLTVRNPSGATGTASLTITSGNTLPTLTISAPPSGGLFEFGESVNFAVSVSDPEDGTIDCARVTIQAILGHDSHGHPLDQHAGCTATVATTLSSGHGEDDNIFYLLEASYTDRGGSGGSGPLTGRAQVLLQPKHRQAEFFSGTGRTVDGRGNDAAGVAVEAASEGGSSAAFIQDGDWWSFDPLALNNITGLRVRASSAAAGGTLEVRRNSPTGTLVASVPITATGGWQTWRDFPVTLTNPPAGTGSLFFVARNPAGQTGPGFLFNVNWIDFLGAGVGLPPTTRVISLRAHANNLIVTADNGGANPLIANRAAVGAWEQFDLINNADGSVSFLAHANGKIVTADNAGASALIANRTAVGAWEEFDLIHNADGSISLRAHANGRLVTAENAGASPLIANRTAVGPWEEFDLIG